MLCLAVQRERSQNIKKMTDEATKTITQVFLIYEDVHVSHETRI